jgi:predicted RecB family nuclease
MGHRITRDIVESYLKCKTKAHMKVLGEHGSVTDYELLLLDKRREVRQKAIDEIFARHEAQEKGVLRDIPITRSVLERGATLVLATRIEAEFLSLDFDALKKVPGVSSLGEFHYVPVLYHEGEKLRQEQRLILAILASVLGDVQGRQPDLGVVYLGDRCRGTKVRLTGRLKEGASKILREIRNLWRDRKPSKLMLNSHCEICEFRDRCRRQAEQEDDLTLLSGMGEKELRKHNRKGIFTITQLSCTFRLRKRGKRVKRKNQPHYFALQAAAIRDKKTYALKPPGPPHFKFHM